MPEEELITAIELPPPGALRSATGRCATRASYAFALVSAAVAVDSTTGDVRIALGGVAPAPWRAARAEEEALRGKEVRSADLAGALAARWSWRGPYPETVQGVPRRPCGRRPARGAFRVSVSRVGAIGAPVERRDAREKVTGRALYAYDNHVEGVAYAAVVNRGSLVVGSRASTRQRPSRSGCPWRPLLRERAAPRAVQIRELMLFQSNEVSYYGQIMAAVVAERPRSRARPPTSSF